MKPEVLILFSRKGCCLCETLERKLSNISLTNLNPPLVLSIVDIDSKEVSTDIHMKYTNEVPVIILDSYKLFLVSYLLCFFDVMVNFKGTRKHDCFFIFVIPSESTQKSLNRR